MRCSITAATCRRTRYSDGVSAPQSSRPAAIAGLFYEARPDALARQVDRLLDGVPDPGRGPPPKAMIVPHAGLVYSGPVAATGYARLRARADTIERVVILAPSHRVYLEGLALPVADRFETPLGSVAVDGALVGRIAGLPQVVRSREAHAREHAVEVHLPFLQRLLPRFTLLPLVVGRAEPAAVAEVLAAVWGGPETLIVISSDLSHFHDHATATELDRATAAAIVAADGPGLDPQQACGARCIDGLLAFAERRPLRIELLDLRTSADTFARADRERVVGYGTFAVHEVDA